MEKEESAYPLKAQSDALSTPIAHPLGRLVDFNPEEGGKGESYVRLDIGWPELFYRLEEIGNCLICSTNGWARFNRHQAFSGWRRIPGGDEWVQTQTGSVLDTSVMGSIIVVEQDNGSELMLSIQLIHQNGHGHVKIVLSCESNLSAYYDLVRDTAVSGPILESDLLEPAPEKIKIPDCEVLEGLWAGACHSMPSETYPGCGSLARWTVLKHLSRDFVEQVPTSCFGGLIDQWIKYHCNIRLNLFHPDHQISEWMTPRDQCTCNRYWHIYGNQWQCHMPKGADIQLMLTSPDPQSRDDAWLEIYHEPSRRLLAWIRPENDPIDKMHWRKSLTAIKTELNAQQRKGKK